MKLLAFDHLAVPFYRIGDGDESYLKYNNTAIAPHALVARQTHTMVSLDSVYVAFMSISLRRATAAAPVGVVTVQLTFNPNIADVIMHTFRFTGNTANEVTNQIVPINQFIRTPVNLKIWTADTSTGGTVDYDIFVGLYDYLDQ